MRQYFAVYAHSSNAKTVELLEQGVKTWGKLVRINSHL